jgi:hypothetical protein
METENPHYTYGTGMLHVVVVVVATTSIYR